jgi:hypothetical protein
MNAVCGRLRECRPGLSSLSSQCEKDETVQQLCEHHFLLSSSFPRHNYVLCKYRKKYTPPRAHTHTYIDYVSVAAAAATATTAAANRARMQPTFLFSSASLIRRVAITTRSLPAATPEIAARRGAPFAKCNSPGD